MFDSLTDISNFSMLLFLMIFIFSLLGMELFAFSVAYDEDGEKVFDQREIKALEQKGVKIVWPRENFNSIGSALTTIFIVIIGEDWH